MLIGELADEVGVNPKTIRYYESIGLLPEPARTDAGYRRYAAEDAERLAFIRRATELNLQLDEVAEILALRERDERPCGYVVEVARGRIDELDRRITQMQQARHELQQLLERAQDLPSGDGCYCTLIEHTHR
ncbi:MAG: heavy metal-responsive transcriptional regulator [Actinomycetes bacterium]